jgi:tetratricopeptide (TPR) repeat protein
MTKEEAEEPRLDHSLERYETALGCLKAELTPSKEQILEVLLARDALQSALVEQGMLGSTNWDGVNKLDEQLKALAGKVYQVTDLPHWRALVKDKDKEESWWWFLPVTQQEGNKDWLLNALSVTFLTISLGLVSNLGPRFWSGGLDVFSSVGIAGQSVLTLLAAGGVLTKTGREGIERALTRWKLPKQDWQRYVCGVSFGLMVAPIGVYLLLPTIADYYTQQGKRDYKAGQWVSAQRNLQRAILVHPDHAEAHLEMGVLHEDLQELDKAKSEYRIAMQAGNAAAFTNLARLSILDKDNKVNAIISLLHQAEIMARTPDSGGITKEFKYALQKNRGWVRLDQKRYADAKAELLQAQKLIPEKAAAHCLLAQVLNKQNKPSIPTQEELMRALMSGQVLNKQNKSSNPTQEAERQAWKACQKHAQSSVPEEDVWIDQAKKCLNPKTRSGCLDLDKPSPF